MRATSTIPILFVFLWSTAWIALKFCADYAEPATFVLLRLTAAVVLLLVFVTLLKMNWPERPVEFVHSAVVGILIHGVYGGGTFAALYHGMNTSLCALILGLQPLITTGISIAWMNESITWLKTTGVTVGFAGVALLVIYGTSNVEAGTIREVDVIFGNLNTFGMTLCFVALMSISIGMVYQKKFCSRTELFPGACIQYAAAAVFMLPIAMSIETMNINWSLSFAAGLAWLIFAVSIGAMSLLMILIKRGEAGTVSNLFYLVPPLVAIEAWLFFDEKVDLISVVAMLLCMTGVLLVRNAARPLSVTTPTSPTPWPDQQWVSGCQLRKIPHPKGSCCLVQQRPCNQWPMRTR